MAKAISAPTLLTDGEPVPSSFLCLPNNERRMIAGSSGTVPAEKSEAFDEAVMKFFEKH
jgi:non-heme chloroperoxidase